MSEMADKPKTNNLDEEDDIQDHTFHISDKDDNLLEDLPAHSLLAPEDDEESISGVDKSDLKNNISPKQNTQIQETNNIQGSKELLEISNNKIISSSDGRVKKQRPNDLFFLFWL